MAGLHHPVPCNLTPTSVLFDRDESYNIFPQSKVPDESQDGFLLHDLDLKPGPFECGQLDPAPTIDTRPGIDLKSDYADLTDKPRVLGTFRLRDQRIDIVAAKVDGKARF